MHPAGVIGVNQKILTCFPLDTQGFVASSHLKQERKWTGFKHEEVLNKKWVLGMKVYIYLILHYCMPLPLQMTDIHIHRYRRNCLLLLRAQIMQKYRFNWLKLLLKLFIIHIMKCVFEENSTQSLIFSRVFSLV